MRGTALVVGASGIVSMRLPGIWQVHGLARRPPDTIEGVQPVAADLLDPASLRAALQGRLCRNSSHACFKPSPG